MEFKKWLINELNLNDMLSKIKYIDPDDIYDVDQQNQVTFIYTKDNNLYAVKGSHHAGVVEETPELQVRYGRRSPPRRYMLTYGDLLGRVGSMSYNEWLAPKELESFFPLNVVSFWNSEKEEFDLLQACLSKLKEKNIINDSFILSTRFGVSALSNHSLGQKTMSDEEMRELQSKLHVMNPIQKKDAMQQLGMVKPMRKNPWQDNLEKTKTVTPGQKWWAPQSENLHNIHSAD